MPHTTTTPDDRDRPRTAGTLEPTPTERPDPDRPGEDRHASPAVDVVVDALVHPVITPLVEFVIAGPG
jgi:hypothetical protein